MLDVRRKVGEGRQVYSLRRSGEGSQSYGNRKGSLEVSDGPLLPANLLTWDGEPVTWDGEYVTFAPA
jgi:hypothetical protein